MKRIGVYFFLSLPFLIFSQTTVTGTIYDGNSDEVLSGAHVRLLDSYISTYSDQNGKFSLSLNENKSAKVAISFIGFESDTVSAEQSNLEIRLKAKAYHTEDVIIRSTRADGVEAITRSNLSKADIEQNNLGQDLPFLLQQTPSLVTTSDAGAGVGYTGLRIRGSDASRINVTINGIPVNDAESHGVFWVNMPDFASSLESVQIQRGLGNSTNGSAAFGASVNLQTNTLNSEAYGEINNSFGSFNTRKHTVKVGSGLINDHFVFEGRLSQINSDGYIDRASADLKSYFVSGGYYGEKTIVKAIAFGGHEVTYQSWNGTPISRFENDLEGMQEHISNNSLGDEDAENLLNSGRTYNFYRYGNQVDNYKQDHYQLHLSHQFSNKLTSNVAIHYTYGRGFFEEYKPGEALSDYGLEDLIFLFDTIRNSDIIRRRWLENDFYGVTFSNQLKINNQLQFDLGGGINNYEGDHFGEIIWSQFASNSFPTENYYRGTGNKLDGNFYLKSNYQLNKLNLFADIQYRHINYKVDGTDNDLRTLDVDESFDFINPKLGLTYAYNENIDVYAFAGIGHREPNRADFVDQSPNTPKKDANKEEQLTNVELGFRYRQEKYQLEVNGYLMNYKDQLVNTGQLNDVGSPLRQNVDRSRRMGVEIQASYRPIEQVVILANATLSQNRIFDFKETIFDYTTGFETIERDLGNTSIALSPEFIGNAELRYRPKQNMEIAWIQRIVGEQYLDNSSNSNRKLDAYFVSDVRLQYEVPTKLFKSLKLQALINNVLDEDYASNGYTFSYIVGQEITENFVYPQAFRNYLVGLSIGF